MSTRRKCRFSVATLTHPAGRRVKPPACSLTTPRDTVFKERGRLAHSGMSSGIVTKNSERETMTG